MTDEEKELMLQAALEGDFETLAEMLEGKSFEELLEIIQFSSEVIRLARELREKVIVAADDTSPHANRKALAESAHMAPSQLRIVLERNGRPSNRRKP